MESRQGNSMHPTLPLSNSWQPYACTKPWARPRTGWVKLLPPEAHHPRTDNTAGPSPGTQASSTHCLQHPMVQPPFPPPSAPLSPPVLPCACAGACARPSPPWPAGAAAPRAVAMGTGGVRRCGELGRGDGRTRVITRLFSLLSNFGSLLPDLINTHGRLFLCWSAFCFHKAEAGAAARRDAELRECWGSFRWVKCGSG